MNTSYYSSPLGQLEIKSFNNCITSVKFIDQPQPSKAFKSSDKLLLNCFKELDEYFEGTRKDFSFPINQEGTDFQKIVWASLTTIPYGKTISYAQLSQKLGDIKKIRAVGTSNGKNNLAIVIPCHRVIGSNNQLVGYAGGLWRKQWLLNHEAKFANGIEQLKLL